MSDTEQSHDQPTGRRLNLTLLFSDLSGSKALGRLMEAEHYAQLLGEMRAISRAVIEKHGGHIARLQGDGVLAVFGFPEKSEQDGRRATEAALELHAAARQLRLEAAGVQPGGIALHSGVHAGMVYLLDGNLELGRFDLMGDVPNMCDALMKQASRDEILASEAALGPESNFFEAGAREAIRLDGLPPFFRVARRAAVARRFDALSIRGFAPFIGREREFGAMRSCLANTLRGTPQCLAIAGGPGLGKTRLLEEFSKQTEQGRCRVLRGYCESYLGSEPLQPFLQILRTVLGVRPDMSIADAVEVGGLALEASGLAGTTPHAEALALIGAAEGAERPSAGRAIAVLSEFFHALAGIGPLLIVLDDWQWADDASLQVFDALRAFELPIFLLIGTRGLHADSVKGGVPDALDLAPLNLQEASQAITALLPGADPFLIADVHRQAGGNPLFIEELCHSVVADEGDTPLELRSRGAAWLDALVESRVDRLPQQQVAVLRSAAVIGTVFPTWLLIELAGRDACDAALADLQTQDFLFPSSQAGMMRFKHGITRDVVYNMVGLHERRALHLAAATILRALAQREDRMEDLEALAYHCAGAGLADEARDYAERAGDKATALFALDKARARYIAVLEALDALPAMSPELKLRWCVVSHKLGMVCIFDPLALANGVYIFERARELAEATGDVETMTRAEYMLGYIMYSKGRNREAVRLCENALALAERSPDVRFAALVRATLGQSLATAGAYDAAIPMLDSAIDIKRARARPASSLAAGSAYALACKGAVLGDRGLFDDADACFAEALELLGDTVHQVVSSVGNWISAVYQWQGRWTEAVSAATVSMEVARTVKSRQLLAMGRALWAHASWRLVPQLAFVQDMREATQWIEARKGGLVLSLNYGWLIEAAEAGGREQEARRHAARLFLRARELDRLGQPMGCRGLAMLASQRGAWAEATHYLDLAFRSARLRQSRHDVAVTWLCEARIEMARGRAALATDALERACLEFERMGMRWHLAQARAAA